MIINIPYPYGKYAPPWPRDYRLATHFIPKNGLKNEMDTFFLKTMIQSIDFVKKIKENGDQFSIK